MTNPHLASLTPEQLLAVFVFLMTQNPTPEQAAALNALYLYIHDPEDDEPDEDAALEHIDQIAAEIPEDYTPTRRHAAGSSPRFGIDPSPVDADTDN